AWEAIASRICLPAPPVPDAIPIAVFNTLNWERSEVVSWQIPGDLPTDWAVWGDHGAWPYASHSQERTLHFMPDPIPSCGYRVFWYGPRQDTDHIPASPSRWVLDNMLLRVEVCPKTGTLKSVWDQVAEREVLARAGNQLQFFQDQGQYWDAWNIDPNYANYALEAAQLKAIAWVSNHGIQQRLRVELQWRQSVFIQDYVLDWGSSVLKIETQVDWQETHVLIKAAFPISLSAEFATYEIPCGAIQRPTLPNSQPLTEHEKAKWEVPALHWADLTSTDGSYGVSLLNDCKYGYDAQPDCLRLTLLRSPRWPDPACDRGEHRFTYALYPHGGSWQTAHTVRRGYELNRPLCAQRVKDANHSNGDLSPVQSFWSGFADNLVLMALKQSEDSAQHWITRVYEAQGQSANMEPTVTLPLQFSDHRDGLERVLPESDRTIGPWQVRTYGWVKMGSTQLG
ncbi:MAG: glycoside hydrolase family 38 C-terminal domain-containing protein, partial [Thermosynechococcaceae cyanobacterium]